MKAVPSQILSLLMLFMLVGCGRPESRSTAPDSRSTKMADEFHQWVPDGISLAAARQTMEQHQFTCSEVSYDSLAAITNNSNAVQWTKDFIKRHATEDVTNIGVLDCGKTHDCNAEWLMVNDKTYKLLQWGYIYKK